MGYWGIKSYENDLAHDALDAGFDQVHGDRYEALMDDRNPMPYEKVHEELANPETLQKSLAALDEMLEHPALQGDEEERLAWVGVVLRHAECKVDVPRSILEEAVKVLESEDLEWPRPTERKLRLEKELALFRKRLSQ